MICALYVIGYLLFIVLAPRYCRIDSLDLMLVPLFAMAWPIVFIAPLVYLIIYLLDVSFMRRRVK